MLNIFHIQFREQLQTLIMAKTKKRVPYSDEVESSDESPENLDNLIKEARGESEKETKDNGSKEVCFNQLSL